MNYIKDATIFELNFSKVKNAIAYTTHDETAFAAAQSLRQLQTIIDEIKGDLYVKNVEYTMYKLIDPRDYYYNEDLFKVVFLEIYKNSYSKSKTSVNADNMENAITLTRHFDFVEDDLFVINKQEIFVTEAVVSNYTLYTIHNCKEASPLWEDPNSESEEKTK